MRSSLVVFVGIMTIAAVLASSVQPSQTTMKDVFGVDFGENYAISIDLNIESSVFPSSTSLLDNVEVISDHLNGNTNSKIRLSDGNTWYNQEILLTHHNISNTNSVIIGGQTISNNLTIKAPGGLTYNLGPVSGPLLYHSLFQYYQDQGKDVLVANTFRGYLAYTTSHDDLLLDKDDNSYLGYTLLEQNFLNYLNSKLTNNGFPSIPQYTFQSSVQSSTSGRTTIELTYNNILVAWQDRQTELPEGLKNIENLLDGFVGVVTGGNIAAITLFDHLTFRYEIATGVDDERVFVDATTTYEIGSVKLLVSNDFRSSFDFLIAFVSGIDESNSFHAAEHNISFSTNYSAAPWYNVTIPELSFYTSEAITTRLDPRSVVDSGLAGLGFSAITTTNAYKAGLTIDHPVTLQNKSLPISVGGRQFFETSYVNKDIYSRTLPDGTIETGLPLRINISTLLDLNVLSITPNLFQGFLESQSRMTDGLILFIAKALSPVYAAAASISVLDMKVEDTMYITFVQMPEWLGMELTVDPTYRSYPTYDPILVTTEPMTSTETTTNMETTTSPSSNTETTTSSSSNTETTKSSVSTVTSYESDSTTIEQSSEESTTPVFFTSTTPSFTAALILVVLPLIMIYRRFKT